MKMPGRERGTKDEAEPAAGHGRLKSSTTHPETGGAEGQGNHKEFTGAKTNK